MHIIELADIYSPLIEKIISKSSGEEYIALFLEPDLEALSQSDDKTSDMEAIRTAYCLGILERARIASLTSLTRAQRWMKATASSIQADNALGFAASLRGFLESAADAHDVMKVLPSTLAKVFPYLYLALSGSRDVSNVMVSLEALEAKLIHYVYARRPQSGETLLPHHQNKTNKYYISHFEEYAVPGATQLYSELCELTHPAAASVSCFMDEYETRLVFNPEKDTAVIQDVLARHENTIENMFQYSINPAMQALSILQRLFEDWHGPSDASMKGIGNTAATLQKIDSFLQEHVEGRWDVAAFLREIRDK